MNASLNRLLRPLVTTLKSAVPPIEELAERAAAALTATAEAPNRSLQRGLARAVILGRKTARYWQQCDSPKLAAALGFYAMFSLAPMFVILMSIVGLVLGGRAAADTFAQLEQVTGPTAALALQSLVATANTKAANVTALVTGVITALFGAAGLFGQLRDTLDAIFGQPEQPKHGILKFFAENGVAIALVFLTGALLMTSLAVETATAVFASGHAAFVRTIDLGIALAVVATLFSFVYKLLPSNRLHWSEAIVGGVVTGIFLVAGQAFIGWYFGRAAIGSGYGVAGSLMLVLLWVYYSSMTMLVGAAFTRAYRETTRPVNRSGG